MKKPETTNLLSLKAFVEKHSTLVSERQMRSILQKRRWNGAGIFVHRIGRKIFIDEKKFFEWTKR